MKETKRGKISQSIMVMSVVPLLIFGTVVILASISRFKSVLDYEVRDELRSISEAVQVMYDCTFPGEYSVTGDEVIALKKGDQEITGNFEIIDAMKEKTGMEISFIYGDVRMLTTIYDSSEQRLVGTGVNAAIQKEIRETKEEIFYPRLEINGTYFFVYYTPVFNSTDDCMGILAVAKPEEEVKAIVWRAIMPVLVLIGVAMLVASFVSLGYAGNLSRSICRLKDSLDTIAKGNLLKEMDYTVLQRDDEIGEIGKSVVSMQRALRVLIEQDTLTGIYNRRYAQGRLKQTMNTLVTQGSPYCLAIGDIDFFKKVNDTYGHEAGDEILIMVSKTLRKSMLGKGFVARWGGEEFLICFENSRIEDAEKMLNNIRIQIEETVCQYGNIQISVTMSLGVIEAHSGMLLDQLLVAADTCLYEAKNAGRNCVIAKKSEQSDTENEGNLTE